MFGFWVLVGLKEIESSDFWGKIQTQSESVYMIFSALPEPPLQIINGS